MENKEIIKLLIKEFGGFIKERKEVQREFNDELICNRHYEEGSRQYYKIMGSSITNWIMIEKLTEILDKIIKKLKYEVKP